MLTEPTTIYLVEERQNPSTDFFIAPKLLEMALPIQRYNLTSLPAEEQTDPVVLVFVRYISKDWQQWVRRHQARVQQLVFFMDDDLFDLTATQGLPVRYRFKLARLSWRKQRWLQAQQALLWVSTDYLQQKYAQWQPEVLYPKYPQPNDQQLTLFYHGSASHRAEVLWLKPVIEEVLRRQPALSFEIIGDALVNRWFRHIPRVHVLHPMSWASYRALLARGGRAIGLAPLLDGPFNQARSHTKFYDITAAGAVGIYANHPVYQGVIQPDVNGLLVEMDKTSWVDAIERLVSEADTRERLIGQARMYCEQPTRDMGD